MVKSVYESLYEETRQWFQKLERRFQEHLYLHQAFSKFMLECEGLGHINQNNEDANTTQERYYLQRHAFFRSSNSTSHT
jgi:hypothetical protein